MQNDPVVFLKYFDIVTGFNILIFIFLEIILDFFVDMTLLGEADSPDINRQPVYNVPTSSASIQLTAHSPYISVSPYVSGLEFIGGKHYKVKLQLVNIF